MSPCALACDVDSSEVSPSRAEYVVDIVGLNKSFKRRTRVHRSYSTIKSALLGALKRSLGPKSDDTVVTHAIKSLTLRIPRGASVGLIGRNGSGKSTFLKLLTGIYKPDGGRISVNGRIAALIELGAGFHPDFTGRENLFLAGVMHGLSKEEIQSRFDDIVSFAELQHVIDDPVRSYSSGMFMRLGFSIAVHTDPDILLVDEVLAVGDAGFVAKCKDRIGELRKAGKTLVLVTHDLDSVERWCDEAIWLHEGEVKDRGFPRRVIDSYRHFIENGEELQILKAEEHAAETETTTVDRDQSEENEPARWGSREISIEHVSLSGGSEQEKRVFHKDDPLTVTIHYRAHTPESDVVFGIGINRVDGLNVYGTNTEIERIALPQLVGEGRIACHIDRLGLLDGAYTLDVAVHRKDGYPFDYHKGVLHFSVRNDAPEVGVTSPPHRWLFNGEVA
jgi:ABC-type polysaccharide/polyol phosphate transport system ATPase subunit